MEVSNKVTKYSTFLTMHFGTQTLVNVLFFVVVDVSEKLCSEFCKMAKKIFIYSSDEVKKMATKLKISSSLENEEGNDY